MKPPRPPKILHGTKYSVLRNQQLGVQVSTGSKKNKRFATQGDTVPKLQVLSYLSERILKWLPEGVSLNLYTEHRRNGVIFRSHPCYRSRQEWYDWATFDFGLYKQSAQILGFVDLKNGFTEDDLKHIHLAHGICMGDEDGSNRCGYYAVVNELKRNPDDLPLDLLPGSRFIGRGERQHHVNTGQLKLSLLNVESIFDTCIVLDNPQVPNAPPCPFSVLVLQNQHEWADLFVNGALFEENDPDLIPGPALYDDPIPDDDIDIDYDDDDNDNEQQQYCF